MWEVIFKAKTVPTGTSVESDPTRLMDGKTVHAFEYTISGTGTLAITVYTSISGRSWVSNGVKANGVGSTSGPDSDGKGNIPLRLNPGELIKFKATASGGSPVIDLWFVQK